MTSRVLFYKAMLEDFRHRIWTLALSCLASFMAMPVFYLLMNQQWNRVIDQRSMNSNYPNWEEAAYKLEMVTAFFEQYMIITGGIVLGVGAIIVGLFGFRYVFSKKMMDLYHSIPIKRKHLFLISYLNGFLIWFVPMLLGALICAVMAAGFLGNVGAWLRVIHSMFKSIAYMTVVFLLLYHLVITAVMLSGNYLNTLLSLVILGTGVMAAFLLKEAFAETYFPSYYSVFDEKFHDIVWLSPIVSGIYQLVYCAINQIKIANLIANIAMAAALWAAAYGLYMKRPSEMAEQGLKIKSVQFVFRTAVTMVGALAGWLFFGYIASVYSVGWTVFGAVLGGVLVFGVLDIVFHMDFRAFYAHKIHMAACVLISIGIGFVFRFDLTGFEDYIPKKEQIADMGIYMGNMAGYSNDSSKNIVDKMHYTDADVIYTFLEKVCTQDIYDTNGSTRMATVRVGKTNGKSYYRSYLVSSQYEEELLPILSDESYLSANVLISQAVMEHLSVEDERFWIYGINSSVKIKDVKEARELLEAYNQDIMENPDLIMYQNGNILATISADNWNIENYGSENFYDFQLDIYDSMEHVLSLIKAKGYEYVLQNVPAQAVERIEIDIFPKQEQSIEELFGLEEGSDKIYETEKFAASTEIYDYTATFTKEEDIQKLLDVICFHTPSGSYSIFSQEYCNANIVIIMKDGSYEYTDLKKGTMPKELLSYFEQVK